MINDLEEQGFVVFEENFDHKRAKLVRLTNTDKKGGTQPERKNATCVYRSDLRTVGENSCSCGSRPEICCRNNQAISQRRCIN